MKKGASSEERERQAAEIIWLNYFNRYLFETGTISEKDYAKMVEKIAVYKARHCRSERLSCQ